MVAPVLAALAALAALRLGGCRAEYNFDNPYYNRAIFDQMDDYYMPMRENFVEERAPELRRQLRFRNEICCGSYVTENMLREDEWRRECYEDVFKSADFLESWNYFDAETIKRMAQKLICLQQCLWKKRGTMEDRYDPLTGRIRDRERYRRGRGMGEANMNFPEMAVAKCLPTRNPDPSAGWLGFVRPRDCSRAYLDFSYCVWEELHADCPVSLWNSENRWCNQIREYLQVRRRLT